MLEILITNYGNITPEKLETLGSHEIKCIIENSDLMFFIDNGLCVYGHLLLENDVLNSSEYSLISNYKKCIETEIVKGLASGNLTEEQLSNIENTWDSSNEVKEELFSNIVLENFSKMFSSCFELVQYNEKGCMICKVNLCIEDFDNEDEWDHWPGENKWIILDNCIEMAFKEIDVCALVNTMKN